MRDLPKSISRTYDTEEHEPLPEFSDPSFYAWCSEEAIRQFDALVAVLRSGAGDFEVRIMVDAAKEVVDLVGDDHETNICSCAIRRVVNEATHYLDHADSKDHSHTTWPE